MSDTNLADVISQRVAATLTSEFISKEVDTRIDKLVVEAVNNALRSYSAVGQLIEASVTEALKVDRLDLPSYGEIVSSMLKVQIEAKVSDLVAGKLATDMDELLKLAPKEVKLSEITEEMLQPFKDDGDHGEVITVLVEHADRGYTHIFLDNSPGCEKYRCTHQLHIDPEGQIYSAVIDNVDTKKKQRIGRSYGLDQKLRAFVACGTKIILDEDNVQIGVGDY